MAAACHPRDDGGKNDLDALHAGPWGAAGHAGGDAAPLSTGRTERRRDRLECTGLGALAHDLRAPSQ